MFFLVAGSHGSPHFQSLVLFLFFIVTSLQDIGDYSSSYLSMPSSSFSPLSNGPLAYCSTTDSHTLIRLLLTSLSLTCSQSALQGLSFPRPPSLVPKEPFFLLSLMDKVFCVMLPSKMKLIITLTSFVTLSNVCHLPDPTLLSINIVTF